jgi:hypothetical protein
MAAEFAADNGAHLQARLGSDPQPVDLYLAHFLGAEGATRFLDAHRDNPEQPAATLFPAAARANRSIFYRYGGVARSLADIRRNFSEKLGNAPSERPVGASMIRQTVRSASQQRPLLDMAHIAPMPKRLDLDFARSAYHRLLGLST